MSDIPTGWVAAKLADVISGFQAGRNIQAAGAPARPRQYGVLKISAVTWGRFQSTENKALLAGDQPLPHETVKAGDLLITRANTTALVGAPVLVPEDHPWLMLPDKILRVLYRPEAVDARYLLQALRSERARAHMEAEATGTSDSMRNLSQPKLRETPIVLPPLRTQQRIADKLDALLARVDACRSHLNRVPGLIKLFRQAVLDAATNGELTEDWRNGEPPDWACTKLAAVASDFSYGSAAKSSRTGAVPVLRMGNIQGGRLHWGDLVYTSAVTEITKYKLEDGDVLFNRTNSPELVGKTAVYRSEMPAIYAGYLIRVRCGEHLLPDFLNYCLGSQKGRDYCRSVKSDGVSQSNINAKKLAAFELDLPPIGEQIEIVRRVEALLALAAIFEAKFKIARAKADRLPSALLAKAFRGELVPQDPSDEPAALLLARLRGDASKGGGADVVKPRSGRPSTSGPLAPSPN